MDKDKVAIFSGGIYSGDLTKLQHLHQKETVLSNDQAAKLLAESRAVFIKDGQITILPSQIN